MRQLITIFIFLNLCGCGQQSKEELLKGLTSCDVDSICISSYYFGEQRDKKVVRELLTGIKDERVSHHLRHKGMSVYYCKMTALNKISGLNIEVGQTDNPDSVKIERFIEWALTSNLVEDELTIDLSGCASQ